MVPPAEGISSRLAATEIRNFFQIGYFFTKSRHWPLVEGVGFGCELLVPTGKEAWGCLLIFLDPILRLLLRTIAPLPSLPLLPGLNQ